MASNVKGASFVINDVAKSSKQASVKGASFVINDVAKGGVPFFRGATFIVNENLKSGASFRIETTTIAPQIKQQAASFCYCGGCDYEEKVFALIGGESYQNSKSSLISAKSIASDTIVYKLFKNGIEVAILNDNALGVYYDTFASNNFYVGFVIDWSFVYTAFGVGLYTVKTERSILGVLGVLESHKYRLQIYNDQLADGTILIEAVHGGNHLKGINYIDLLPNGWVESYRIKGGFTSKVAVSETDIYRTNNNIVKQIQGRENAEYTLKTKPLPVDIWERIVFIDVMATLHFYVTDYNIVSPVNSKNKAFNRLDLVKSETETESFADKSSFTMTFIERLENNEMSNF